MISRILILLKWNLLVRLAWILLSFPSRPVRYSFLKFLFTAPDDLALQLHCTKNICGFTIKCSADCDVPGQDVVEFGAELNF